MNDFFMVAFNSVNGARDYSAVFHTLEGAEALMARAARAIAGFHQVPNIISLWIPFEWRDDIGNHVVLNLGMYNFETQTWERSAKWRASNTHAKQYFEEKYGSTTKMGIQK